MSKALDWWLLCSIVLFVLQSLAFKLLWKLPSVDTSKRVLPPEFKSKILESELYRLAYKRRGPFPFNTSFVSVPNLLWYSLCNIFGYCYVVTCNLDFSSHTLLHSNDSSNADFFMTVLMAPILFFLSTVVVLKS